MKRVLLIVFLLVIFFCVTAFADDDYTSIDGEDFFNDTVESIASGDLSIAPKNIITNILDRLLEEIRTSKDLILSIFIIAIISGVLNSVKVQGGASDAAFFSCFCRSVC